MESENQDVHAQDAGPAEANSQRPASSVGVTLESLDVELDPVSDEEESIRDRLDGSPDEQADARDQLEMTAGIHSFLKYLESAVPIEDFGPDEGDEGARKDFAILLGRVARKHGFGWLTEYEDEIFCAALGLALYGGPAARALAPKLTGAYNDLVGKDQTDEQTNGQPDGSARETKDGEINPASRRAKRRAGDT